MSVLNCRIEAGYRAYHATVLSLLRQHPHSISTANAAYQQQLCSKTFVQDPDNTTVLPATAVAADSSSAINAATQSVPTVVNDASAASVAGQLQTPTATVVAAGVEFVAQLDLFRHYIEEPVGAAVATAEQEAAAAAKAVAAVKADAAAAVLKAASEAAAAEAAAAETAATAAAAAAAAEAKASKGGKDAKGKPAAAAPKVKEASTAADKAGKGGKKAAADKAAAEAAAAAAEPPVAAFEFGGVKVPLDRQGAALCLEDSLPELAIKQVLQTFQMQFLEDMVTFCEEAESSGRSWAGEEEVATTEELEARLRSHRSLGLPKHTLQACTVQKYCLRL